MDTKAIGKYSYIVGLALALLGSLFSLLPDSLAWIVVLLAVLAGLFHFDMDETKKSIIIVLGAAAVAGALGAIPAIGSYLDGFVSAYGGFMAPVVAVLLLRKAYASLMG